MRKLFLTVFLLFVLVPALPARADGYAVGEIPYEVGVSPSGGRTISVPVMTAPCRGAAPEVVLCYNSQGGDGVAGFGWDIGRLSSITLAPKTMYYDGTVGEPDPSLPSSQVFALDGVRLVDNLESYDFPDYDYVTVQGRIFIQKVVSSNGEIVCFDALLPDGSRRRYGFSNNTLTKLTYPLTESIDPLGYYIKYTYIESGNRYYPTSIRYGSQNSSSLPSEIRFSYSTRSRSEEMFISGHQVLLSKLLASVTSYNDGQVLRNYSFSHRLSGREMCLSQIDCSAPDGSALNPLFFSYGQTGADRGLVTERQITLWSYPSGTGNRFRGKFLPQSYSDGLIAYTDGYPTYGIVQGDESAGDDLQFGSLFPANGIICVYQSLDTSALPYQITAGTGFQVAGAADIDGDGVDEMVKVNFGVFDEEESTLDITVFHFNETQTPSSYFGDVSVSGTVQDGDYYSPMSRSYFFGDFLGNGKTQLLSVAHSFNGYFGGWLRDPETLEIYEAEDQPNIRFGRGFTGHEHLPWFGLINMNARLYDPLTGRFLSPYPYVQAPDFTQNFNRYSYALNNPLKYTDESGEWIGWDDVIAGLIGGAINWAINGCKFTWEGLGYFGIGAAAGVAEGIDAARSDYKNPWTRKDRYPDNNGFLGTPETGVLQPGVYDRYGGDGGYFLAPEGTPFESRNLQSFKNDMSMYARYEVVKPISGVKIGAAAPWFGYPGGGTQYCLPKPIQFYIDKGFIIKL